MFSEDRDFTLRGYISAQSFLTVGTGSFLYNVKITWKRKILDNGTKRVFSARENFSLLLSVFCANVDQVSELYFIKIQGLKKVNGALKSHGFPLLSSKQKIPNLPIDNEQ